MKAIGIDLGTTNSAVAYYDPDRKRADIVPNLTGDRLTPSVVGPRITDGKREVGRRAQQYAQRDSKNTIISVKRLMGRDYADPAVVEARGRLSYQIVEGPGEDPRAHVMIGEDRYAPAEVSAMILDKLKTDSGARLGETPTHAVITVPAYFTEGQRAATREAGERAGLVVKRIIDEPTAAAIAFGVDLTAGDRRRILVYDLGGGTFDISILNAVNSPDGKSFLQALKFTGDPWLGGDDFDLLIVDRIVSWVKDNTGQDPTSDTQFRFLAKDHAERAKRELTELASADIYFGGLRGADGLVLDVEMTLTRADFEQMIAPLVAKTIDLVRRALDEAKVSKEDISDVLLVGGSTLTPAVYRAVEQFFGPAKVRRNLNPMECVAIGAGILAGTLEGIQCPDPACRTVNDESRTECSSCGHSLAEGRTTGSTEVYDVTGMAMGIAAVRGSSADAFIAIIPSGHPYPMSDPIRHSFEATDSRKIKVPVFEGNDPVASKNTEVGVIEFELPEEIDVHTRVEVEFLYDRNRELAVTITVPGTTISYQHKLRLDAQRSVASGQTEPEETDESELREDLQWAIQVAQRFVQSYEEYLGPAGVLKIRGDIERAEQTLVFADPGECERMRNILYADVLDSGVASALFKAERMANHAPPAEAQVINQAISNMQKSHRDGRTDEVKQQAQVLNAIANKVASAQSDVTEIGDAETYQGLLRQLDRP
jgi:molecular chaperone DnaK